jgi:hypothetical protein
MAKKKFDPHMYGDPFKKELSDLPPEGHIPAQNVDIGSVGEMAEWYLDVSKSFVELEKNWKLKDNILQQMLKDSLVEVENDRVSAIDTNVAALDAVIKQMISTFKARVSAWLSSTEINYPKFRAEKLSLLGMADDILAKIKEKDALVDSILKTKALVFVNSTSADAALIARCKKILEEGG